MRKFILTPNPKSPHNLRRISPNWDLLKTLGTEEAVLQHVIKRNKEVGLIPCETETERTQYLADYQEKHANHPDAPSLILPPVGLHWVVDESELPGGCVSPENDVNYYFDAWEWED
jgi:hypothetical protein